MTKETDNIVHWPVSPQQNQPGSFEKDVLPSLKFFDPEKLMNREAPELVWTTRSKLKTDHTPKWGPKDIETWDLGMGPMDYFMRKYGLSRSVLVDEGNAIIAGRRILKAMLGLRNSYVPVFRITGFTPFEKSVCRHVHKYLNHPGIVVGAEWFDKKYQDEE